jgi:dolichol-phosphate mannosyltransferase
LSPAAAPAASLSIVVPTYNERDRLPDLVSAVFAGYSAEGLDAELIIVDDNSPDGTGRIADTLAAASPDRVLVLHRTGPRGLGRSLIEGLRRALADGADLIFEMDADWSHDPEYLPALASAAAHLDLVIGSRYLNGVSVVNWPLHRIMLSTCANRYIRIVTSLSARDCTSGYRCWRRDCLAKIPLDTVISEGYAFLVETLYLAQKAGCHVGEVPIIFVERRQGASKISASVLIESIIVPWRLRLGP